MKIHKRYIFRVILPVFAFAACLTIAWADAPVQINSTPSVQEELTIIDNGLSGITIIYTPNITIKTETIDGTVYTTFEVSLSTCDGKPGEPVIPQRPLLIAIPEDADPAIELVTDEYRTLTNVVAANAPGTALSDTIFSVNRWLPGESYSSEKPAYIRLQRVLPVKLNPVQYNPALHEARVASRIVLNIAFNSAGAGTQTAPDKQVDSKFENTYENILINYSSSRNWRRLPLPVRIGKKGQFADGLWYTIPVTKKGIYRITYQDLMENGISPGSINPQTIKIFNNGGLQLPEGLNDPRPDGLMENAIRVIGEEDGSFDDGDYILFYGCGTDGWEWNTSKRKLQHYQSVYAAENVYWFTYGGEPGKRMNVVPFMSTGANSVETGGALVYREDERHKMHHSGNNWYMEILFYGESHEYEADLTGYKPGTEAQVRILAASDVDDVYHEITTEIDGEIVETTSFFGKRERLISVNIPAQEGEILGLRASYTSSNSLSQIYLDWYEIEYKKNLTAVDGQLKFQAPDSTGLVQFKLSGFTNDRLDIYNISDFDNVYAIDFSFEPSTSTVIFSDTLYENRRRFMAVENTRYLEIPAIIPQAVTDLRDTDRIADMLIIAPREFEEDVQPLKDFREAHDDLQTEVVLIEDIYNNFSGGLQDPVAIRDFVRFTFENWTDGSNPPRYLLLFGDGHYDYLGVHSSSAQMRIPPFQVNNIDELTTRAMDDFYGYVSGDDNYLDIAIGRLPVQSGAMARDVVEKIINYQSNPFYGPWRSRITFTADDEITPDSHYEQVHTDMSERIAGASYIPPYLDKRKIYLMEYPEVRGTAGVRKPAAEDDLIAQINEGTLILNYIGHGSERVLAHEWLLNREVDMPRIDNGRKLFFFYIASCTFGRWDIPDEDSMGELLVTASDRGAVGTVSAVRDVFGGPNFALMNAFYRNFFNGTRTTETFGTALMQAKLSYRSINSEKYHLLGDPSVYLDLPDDILSINSIQPDSLKALATVEIAGAISTPDAFEGTIFTSVYDTEKDVEHIIPNGRPVHYKLPGSSIFRGKAEISPEANNQFSVRFIVPKDITYGGDNGRVSLYAWNDERDGVAALGSLPVGGTQVGVIDNEGPEMQVLFDERRFVSGDIVSANPELLLRLSDPHGINITGEVGHKIELVIDDNPDVVDLSKYFEYDKGSYTSGDAKFLLTDFSPGKHTLTVRAWDNFNNSSTFKGMLDVVAEDGLIVQNVLNYPNPFSDETQFTCQINAPAEIEIKIFTVRGRLIKTLRHYHTGNSSFFASPPWDGTDEDGDRIANGTYLYKLIAKTDISGTLQQVEKIEKLVIMR